MRSLLFAYKNSFSNIQRNIWVLAISMFINRSGSMVLLFASLYFTHDLHFSFAQAGVVMSFYGMGSICGSYLGGWLTDRKNLGHIMMASLAGSGIILLCLLLTSNPVLISVIIFFYALVADIFRPANSKATAQYSDPDNLTRSVSLIRLAINLGFSVGPAAGGFIALYFGYKWLFAIDSVTSIGAAVMLWFYLPRIPHEKKSSAIEKQKPKSLSAYKDVSYLLFIILVSLYAICFFQIFASVPQYFSKECNYSSNTIGLLLALNGFLVVVIEMPFITMLEKNKRIFRYIIMGTLCLPVCFSMLLFGHNLMVAAIFYTVIITFSEIFAMPFMMKYVLSKPEADRQGQYAALYSIAYGIANICAPLLGLGIADRYGFEWMFYFFIVVSICVAIGFYFLAMRNRKILLTASLES